MQSRVEDSYQIRVELDFCAGHRLMGHEGKCIYPHGHNYKAEIWVSASALDRLGRVMDFSELKHKVSAWIDANWDHAFLLNSRDKELLEALEQVGHRRLYTFEALNPSAEVMAEELCHRTGDVLGREPAMVRLWETPTQYAEYRPAG